MTDPPPPLPSYMTELRAARNQGTPLPVPPPPRRSSWKVFWWVIAALGIACIAYAAGVSGTTYEDTGTETANGWTRKGGESYTDLGHRLGTKGA